MALPIFFGVAGSAAGWLRFAGLGLFRLRSWGRATLETLLFATVALSLLGVGFLAASFSTLGPDRLPHLWPWLLLAGWLGPQVVILTFLRSPEVRAQFGEGFVAALED